jgi:long-subunit acyl-CoA synthetase (AMP-forming)
VKLEPTDVHISYLPLAHMFERCVQARCPHSLVFASA